MGLHDTPVSRHGVLVLVLLLGLTRELFFQYSAVLNTLRKLWVQILVLTQVLKQKAKPSTHEYFLSTTEYFLAHLSRRLTRWAYRMGLEPASVRACVRASTLSNMNISETRRPITTKFYLKHHWGGGKAALGFDADQIRTLVSMATDSSHRVIMGKRASSRFLGCFWSDPFYTCR